MVQTIFTVDVAMDAARGSMITNVAGVPDPPVERVLVAVVAMVVVALDTVVVA